MFLEVANRNGNSDWHFSFTEPCYPTAAFYDNGEMHKPGLTECGPPTRDVKGRAHDFPTYFLTRYCDYGNGHAEWHVMYNVYFPWVRLLPHYQVHTGNIPCRVRTRSVATTMTGSGLLSSGSLSPITPATGIGRVLFLKHTARLKSINGATILIP